MTAPKPPRTRFDVVLNEQLARDYDELARREHVSRADIFKRSMAAYKLLKEESARGARIIVQEEGQPDRQLIALGAGAQA